MEGFPSQCPACFQVLRASLEPRGREVWLRKACPEHGAFEGRFWDDAQHLAWSDAWGEAACAPGQEGCCGPAKRCVAVVDVTERCNLACAFCYASSHPGLPEKPRSEVTALLETVRREAGLVPLQLSGGEPTTRADLPEIVREARAMGFGHVMVNTNGLALARRGYARALRGAGATAAYLQFDGLRDEVYALLRGAPLLDAKLGAIQACREAALPVVLVPTVVRGVNDGDLGAIVRFALANLDAVRGVVLQPVARFGRWAFDSGHLSIAGIAERLAAQTGFLGPRDLLPFPCCSPRCAAATVVLESPGGPVAVTRFASEDLCRELVAAVGERGYLDVLAGTDGEHLQAAAEACGCLPMPPGAFAALRRRSLVLAVQAFMEAETADLARLRRCCIVVPTPSGALAPFCGWNLTDRAGRYALRPRYQERGLSLLA